MDRVSPWKPFATSIAILLVMLARPCTSSPGDPPRTEGLDAIIIADTTKGPAGTKASGDEMNALLDRVRGMGFDVNVTRLPADQVSPGNIRNAIRTLDRARMRKRTLLVYYAGHGGTDPRTGHFLSTTGRRDVSPGRDKLEGAPRTPHEGIAHR